jgi:putative transposase
MLPVNTAYQLALYQTEFLCDNVLSFCHPAANIEGNMPYWRLYYHINWPTKNRAHLIDEQFENELFTYLNRKATAIKCHILAMGACPDHMHLIISIPPSAAVSDVIKRLKGSCSHDFPNLHWQHGYGVVSVSENHYPQLLTM